MFRMGARRRSPSERSRPRRARGAKVPLTPEPMNPTPSNPAAPRKRWSPPSVTRLPRLTDLTLTTGDGIPGDGDIGGGSTVVP
jgi:hypothetical protein